MDKTYNVFIDDVKGYFIFSHVLKCLKKSLKSAKFYEFTRKKNLKEEIAKAEKRLKALKRNIFIKLDCLNWEDFCTILQNTKGIEVKAYAYNIPGCLDKQNPKIEKVKIIDTVGSNDFGTVVIVDLNNKFYDEFEPISTIISSYEIYTQLEKNEVPLKSLKEIEFINIAISLKKWKQNNISSNFFEAILKYLDKKIEGVA